MFGFTDTNLPFPTGGHYHSSFTSSADTNVIYPPSNLIANFLNLHPSPNLKNSHVPSPMIDPLSCLPFPNIQDTTTLHVSTFPNPGALIEESSNHSGNCSLLPKHPGQQPFPHFHDDPFQFCAENACGTIGPYTPACNSKFIQYNPFISDDQASTSPFFNDTSNSQHSWLLGSVPSISPTLYASDFPNSSYSVLSDCLADPAWTYNDILASGSNHLHFQNHYDPIFHDKNKMNNQPISESSDHVQQVLDSMLDIEDFSRFKFPTDSQPAFPLIPIGPDTLQLLDNSADHAQPCSEQTSQLKGKGTRARKRSHLVKDATISNTNEHVSSPVKNVFTEQFAKDLCLLNQPVFHTELSDHVPKSAATELANNDIPGNDVYKRCSNCHVPFTPLWRRGLNDEILCNACGLYIKLHGHARPAALCTLPPRPVSISHNECANCYTKETSLWRKGPDGMVLCNACQLFWKLHNKHRNPLLKASAIKKRNRAKRT